MVVDGGGRVETVQMRRSVHTGAVLALLGGVIVAFLLLAAHGAEQADRGERVLPSLDPFIDLVRRSGRAGIDWLMTHGGILGRAVSAVAVTLVIIALIAERLRALPLVLLGASITAAIWGQALLWVDQIQYGTAAYLAGMTLALAFGICCPAPQWRSRTAATPLTPAFGWAECALVFLLIVGALLLRLYALTELPNIFVGEMAVSMLASRTSAGLRWYIPGALTGNSNGMWHLFPQLAFYHLFGTSIYSLRLAAVSLGTAIILPFYWLLRRLSGRRAAVIGTLLLLAGPEQLWWSRAENTYFVATMVLGTISALLATWMLQRFSFPALCANALWMPFTRHFYLAGVAMMAYPMLLYVHGLVFVRRVWRTIWYAVPVLVGGTLLWLVSLSLVFWLLTGGRWVFLNPAFHGEAMGHRSGAQSMTEVELLRQQAISAASNLSTVIQFLTYNGGGEGWYKRLDAVHHSTVIDAGVVVVLVVGLGYLLAQIYEPRVFVLLCWLALGVLPGVVSTSPMPRRITVAFPAIYAIAAVTLDAFLRVIRERGGRLTAWLAGGLTMMAVAGMVWTSLASHFSLPIEPVPFTPIFRFSKPLFDDSDAIYHNLDGTMSLLLAFASADRLVAPNSPPCFQSVAPRDWLSVALRQPCDFSDPVYRLTLPQARIDALRVAYTPPRRVTFLLDGHAPSLPQLTRLRALFPEAEERPLQVSAQNVQFVSLSVNRAVLDARRSPTVAVAADEPAGGSVAERILADTQLRPVAPEPTQAATVVHAGLLLQHEGWYRFGVTPACSAVTLTIDQRRTDTAIPLQPLLAGVHDFQITLPRLSDCELPLHLQVEATGIANEPTDTAPLLLDPMLISRPELSAPHPVRYDGYGPPSELPGIRGRPWDFGLDAEDNLIVAAIEGTSVVMQRFGPDGREAATWKPDVPLGAPPSGLVVTPDGGSILFVGHQGLRFDRNGTPAGVWQDPLVITSHVGVLADGRILSAVPNYAGVALLGLDGKQESVWSTFDGGPGVFTSPVSATVNRDGDIAVLEQDGHVLLFHNSVERFAPRFVRRFHMDFTQAEVGLVPLSFDGRERVLAGDPHTSRVLVYQVDGQRLLAADPHRDPSNEAGAEVRRFAATADRLYLLDGGLRLWRIAR